MVAATQACWGVPAQAKKIVAACGARLYARASRASPATAPCSAGAAAVPCPVPPALGLRGPVTRGPVTTPWAGARGLATRAGGGARGAGGGKKKSADGESIRKERGEATERAFKDKINADIDRSIKRVSELRVKAKIADIYRKSSLGKSAYTIDHVLQVVREGDAERVRFACDSLKVADMKAVLRELGGAVYGTRALLLARILRFLPGSSAKSQGSSADPREVLGTGGERRPVLAQSLKSTLIIHSAYTRGMILLRISGGFQATPRRLIPADAATVILNQNHQDKPKEKSDANSVYTLNMEGKDVVTGKDLPEKSLLVSRANDAFYNAYETADIKAMRMVWSKVHILVQCCLAQKKKY